MGVPGFRPPAESLASEVSLTCSIAKPRNRVLLIPPPPKIVPTPAADPEIPEPKLLHLCESCGECFTERESLNEHLKWAHKPRVHKCHALNCMFTAKSFQLLKVHSQKVHAIRPIVDREVDSRPKTRKCLHQNKCKQAFSTWSELRNHAVEHLEHQLYCPKCGECFLSTYGLELHACHAPQNPETGDSEPMLVVDSKKVSTCRFCKMHLAAPALLKLHFKRHRTKSKHVVTCTLGGCKKPFYAPRDLRLHVILSHLVGDADNFVHACDFPGCVSEFVSLASLRVHKIEEHLENASKVDDCVTVPFTFVDIKDAIEDDEDKFALCE
jgi:hypothetical protein